MLLEDNFGCITEWGDYVPYYDKKGLRIKDFPVFEPLYKMRPLTKQQKRFFDCYYSKSADNTGSVH
jgi:hypothetical protein